MTRPLRRNLRKLRLLALATLSLTLTGCSWLFQDRNFGRNQEASTPLVDFLYADGQVPLQDAQPELHLPIRVAVSFLPNGAVPARSQIGAIDRGKVLDALRENFKSLPYVSEIVIVPDYYLRGGRGDGFAQIEQLSRLYQFDLIALVSYDQLQDSSQNDRSLAYLTIVGAYFVRGDRNETHTLLDVAVIDPKTRALVMRAGGTSALKGNVTGVEAEHHSVAQSARGFELATGQLITNFSRELTDFEQRVRDGTAPVKVVRQGTKSGGSGALDPLLLAVLLALAAMAMWTKVLRRGASLFARKRGMSPFTPSTAIRGWRGRRSSASARS
jgi:rhombotail lipoprotein